MRERFLSEFDRIWIDSLNGDSRETGKLTPDGKPDPSVFSTPQNREGIRLGTAVCVAVRRPQRDKRALVRYRDFWGQNKRAELFASLSSQHFEDDYQLSNPSPDNRHSFRPSCSSMGYTDWPRLTELCSETPISGLQEMRRGALTDIDRHALEHRIELYLNGALSFDEVRPAIGGLGDPAGRFDAVAARAKLLGLESFALANVRRYALYPFDLRWAYHSNVRPLWNEPRPALAAQAWSGNGFFVARRNAERPHENVPVTFTTQLPDYHLLRPNVVAIPIATAIRPSGHARDRPSTAVRGWRGRGESVREPLDPLLATISADSG